MLCPQHRAGSLDLRPYLHPECKTSQIFPLGLISLKEGMGTGEGIGSTWCLFSPREMPGRWLHNSCCPFSLSRLLLGARLSSSFPSKVLGQAMCADDRVLLLQLFIMGAQEPGERFWVHRTFVSLLSWLCFLPGSLCSSLGSAKWRLHLNPEHSGAKSSSGCGSLSSDTGWKR